MAPWPERAALAIHGLRSTTERNKSTGRERKSRRTHRDRNQELGTNDGARWLLEPDDGSGLRVAVAASSERGRRLALGQDREAARARTTIYGLS